MADLFLVLFFVSFIGLIVGLIKPSTFTHVIKREITRKKIGLVFGVGMFAFLVLTGVTATDEPKEKVAQQEPEKIIETEETTEKEESDVGAPEIKPATQVENTIILNEPAISPSIEDAPVAPASNERDRIIAILKTNAGVEWGTNYQMVKYELDNQIEAYDWVVQQTQYPNIMVNAKQEWDYNYQMVKYEYENQAGAYEWIVQQTKYPNIMSSARQEWGTNYQMVKYEYENQVEAYESL